MSDTTSDVLLIDKPAGITSHTALVRLKHALGDRKVKLGHAGTLDPLATGLMLVGVGAGTKKLKEYVGLPKEYHADILLGERRSTGDMGGDIIETASVPELREDAVRGALGSMVGTHRLSVSPYSAIKQGGVPLYKKARRGAKLVVPLRDMTVMDAEYLSHVCEEGKCVVCARFFVESGTYIRSLAEELGKRLGYPATLKNLRRTKIGNFGVDDPGVIRI